MTLPLETLRNMDRELAVFWSKPFIEMGMKRRGLVKDPVAPKNLAPAEPD